MAGTSSGAGKSTVAAGLCRLLARDGAVVAPFKAQNMSNHSAVTADGGEVGRAQAMQAMAAGVDVTTAMNPILLKPAGNATSHVVVNGREVGVTDARDWGTSAVNLRDTVLAAYRSLRENFEVVVAEGAGGAAEINLFDRDVVNLPFAAAAGIRSVLVVDIDRGGAFAAAYGTVALLPQRLRGTVAGILFNRFRGDPSLLDPGISELRRRTGVPVVGVLPHLGEESLLGVEDSLDISAASRPSRSANPLRVAAVRLPRLANPSDLDPLIVEDDVVVRWATTPGEVADVDLIVLPGSRATVADMMWMVERGLDNAIVAAHASGRDIIGICAGAQMLGTKIFDGVESEHTEIEGLGLLPTETRFEPDKVVRRRTGIGDGAPVSGYQIHFGRTTGGTGWLTLDDPAPAPDNPTGQEWVSARNPPESSLVEVEGAVSACGRVRATSLHGIFDSDRFRRRLLAELADRHRRSVEPSAVAFAARIDAQHDRLADWVADHADIDRLRSIIDEAARSGLEPGW